jgi:hypothetical protein
MRRRFTAFSTSSAHLFLVFLFYGGACLGLYIHILDRGTCFYLVHHGHLPDEPLHLQPEDQGHKECFYADCCSLGDNHSDAVPESMIKGNGKE